MGEAFVGVRMAYECRMTAKHDGCFIGLSLIQPRPPCHYQTSYCRTNNGIHAAWARGLVFLQCLPICRSCSPRYSNTLAQ